MLHSTASVNCFQNKQNTARKTLQTKDEPFKPFIWRCCFVSVPYIMYILRAKFVSGWGNVVRIVYMYKGLCIEFGPSKGRNWGRTNEHSKFRCSLSTKTMCIHLYILNFTIQFLVCYNTLVKKIREWLHRQKMSPLPWEISMYFHEWLWPLNSSWKLWNISSHQDMEGYRYEKW